MKILVNREGSWILNTDDKRNIYGSVNALLEMHNVWHIFECVLVGQICGFFLTENSRACIERIVVRC